MIPNKPYKLSFDERRGYLYAHVSSDKASPEMAISYLNEIIAECRELGYGRVIVERDIPDPLPLKTVIGLSSHIAKIEIGDLKIAALIST